jgi:hypothetical protein
MPNMNVGFASSAIFKRQNRFVMHIPNVTHVGNSSVRVYNRVLIEEKSARPKLGYKEIEVPHLIETIRYAGRPEWEPLNVTLYDVAQSNPAWAWITSNYYLRTTSSNSATIGFLGGASLGFKRNVQIFMLDGCGYAIEGWTYINAYPIDVDWGDTDMQYSDAMRINMKLRYDRAYWEPCTNGNILGMANAFMIP